jgi:hypothetical protein
MLRLIAATPDGLPPQKIYASFPAYTDRARDHALQRLSRSHLIGAVVIAGEARWQITGLGRGIASSPNPPRWSAPRRTAPRTATIAP